jgi:Na+/H+-dicarboxylate symporter
MPYLPTVKAIAPKAPIGAALMMLYVQVLCAITIGVLLGHFYPSLGAQMSSRR